MKLKRRAKQLIDRYRKIFPVVGIIGPRQSGKTTLARQIQEEFSGSVACFDLERQADFRATEQIDLFLDSLTADLVIIDEIQRRPELFIGLRSAVDANRKEGRFLILGSASPEIMRDSSESLAGRVGYVELPPLTIMEIEGTYTSKDHWLKGGFPNSIRLSNEDSCIWRENFIKTYLERDIRELSPGINAGALQQLLPMLSHVHAQPLNYSMLGKSLGLSTPTIKRYLQLLEASFFVRLVTPHVTNSRKRLVKAPRMYLRDSGLLHTLLGIESYQNLLSNPILGASWEGYVLEQIAACNPNLTISSFRTADQAEVDIVLTKKGDRNPIAVEVKINDDFKLSRGNYSAIEAIDPAVTYVVTPNARNIKFKNGIESRSLEAILKELKEA